MISDNIFLELSKKVQNLGFKQSLIEISNIAFEEMDLDRLSVWKFVGTNTLKCRFKQENNKKGFGCDDIIDLNKYPIYLKSILSENIIVANNVYTDSRTFELSDYYEKINLSSSIHIPIYVDGLIYGVVFMSKKEHHFWTNEEIKFGMDVSHVINIAYIASKRNEDLMRLNSFVEKIKQHNIELLEVIKQKNDHLIEYGFINSHLLNAPLSRLKGLMNILVLELNGEKRESEINFIISKILEEYEEMDSIVNKISLLVNNGESLNRNSINILKKE